jgi:uncharacterized protein YukE
MVSLSKLLMAAAQVVGVVGTINRLMNSIVNQVTNPLNNWVNHVVGGVWKGDGATRFVEEMKSLVIPQLSNLAVSIGSTGTQVNKAMETINNADNQAGKIAGALMDQFKGIYH